MKRAAFVSAASALALLSIAAFASIADAAPHEKDAPPHGPRGNDAPPRHADAGPRPEPAREAPSASPPPPPSPPPSPSAAPSPSPPPSPSPSPSPPEQAKKHGSGHEKQEAKPERHEPRPEPAAAVAAPVATVPPPSPSTPEPKADEAKPKKREGPLLASSPEPLKVEKKERAEPREASSPSPAPSPSPSPPVFVAEVRPAARLRLVDEPSASVAPPSPPSAPGPAKLWELPARLFVVSGRKAFSDLSDLAALVLPLRAGDAGAAPLPSYAPPPGVSYAFVPSLVGPVAPGPPGIDAAPSRRRSGIPREVLEFFAVFGWRRIHAKNALAQATRRRLLSRIRERPGDHLREIARGLGLTTQNTAYHLRHLESCGLVASSRVGAQRCFYPSEGGRWVAERARAGGLLRGARRGEMLAAVLEAPGIHQGEIARRLGLAHGSVSWSLRRLVAEGFLAEAPDGNRRCYVATELAVRTMDADLGQRAL
ncbi:MAG: winged helix-turn-helix transcriptional regulator [Methanobacteriota archaeon]